MARLALGCKAECLQAINMQELKDFFQGASNSVASNVSAPVDGIAWLLRKAGLPIPSNPMGGSDWMEEKGLTQTPQNRNAGLLGEFAGMAGPMVAAAKAPQMAQGLLSMADNMAAPALLNSQSGVISTSLGKTTNIDDANSLAQKIRALGPQFVANINEAAGGSVYVTAAKKKALANGKFSEKTKIPIDYKARFADHPSYWGSSISSDPITQNTVEDALNLLKFKLSKNPNLALGHKSGSFVPGDNLGTVSDVGLNKNVFNNGGGERWDDIGEGARKFTFLNR